MKSLQSRPEQPDTIRKHDRFDHGRNGSVLLVVIGMLGILLLAGIAFYTFASQENSSADFYSDAAKVPPAPKMIADVLFDYALEQLIVGPDDSLTQSALRGGRREPVQDPMSGAYFTQIPGRHSLLAGVIGNDGSVYNGEGIKLSSDAGGNPFVDMDQDGTPDPLPNPDYLNLNFSASANAGTLPNLLPYPSLDAGYTSPDINSPYLAYSGGAIDNTTPIGNEYAVLMPSFHRPQYLRGGVATLTAAGNAPRLFRPHPDNVTKSGTMPRFLASSTVHPSLGHTVAAFPMSANVNGTAISQGLWDLTSAPSGSPVYNWDVDNDGDGIREGVWLDLDFPVSQLADGRSCVPMFSFTVMDADGLINLNTSGNSYLWNPPGSPSSPPISYPPTATNYVHRSNMGLSRSEINPMWGLFADATASGATYFNSNTLRDDALTQHRLFWNLPTASYPSANISSVDTANMEFLALLNGRAQFLPAPAGSYMLDGNRYIPMQYMPGRHGDGSLLSLNIAPPGGTSTSFVADKMPAAGVRLDPALPLIGNPGDDDGDQSPTSYSYMGHPVDYLGFGSGYEFRMDPANPANFQLTQMLLGKWDSTTNAFDLTNPIRWPAYNRYSNVGNGNRVSYTISSSLGGMNDLINPSTPARFINPQSAMIDEEDEGIAEPNMITQFSLNDFMYDANEMFGLHGANSDFSSAATGSRLRNLAPFNFALNNQAATIRSQYTTLSMDRFQFGTGLNGNRVAFEVNADTDNDTYLEFPPVTIDKTGTSPFESLRLAVRKQLTVEFGADLSGSVHNNSGFKLNMNQIMDLDLTGAAYSRDLTLHPTIDPGAADLVAVPYANVGATPQTQEYWARRDRQWLARDIYVLLYILGGGNDAQHYQAIGSGMGADPDDNTARNIYTDVQLKEMAQFAVNYVDAMDPDQNITKFEYDKNLGDGWQLDDEAYGDEGGADRGEVYGVELQALTFGESVIVKTIPLPSSKGDNTQVTTFDDTVGRFYTAIELRNTAPYDVDFGYKSWRIRVLDTVDPTRERTLTFYDKTVPAGSQFTIGSRSGSDNDTTTGLPRPSDFRVNFDFDTEGGVYQFDTIIPAQGATSGLSPAAPAPGMGADPGKGDFNLDLVTDDPSSMMPVGTTKVFDLKAGAIASAVGEFVTDAGTTVTFVIERRTNISRDSSSNATDTDNPWVEVDRMIANVQIFDLNSGALPTDLATKLPNLKSKERPEPFDAANEGVCTRDNPASDKQISYRPNTVGLPRNSLPAGAGAADPFHYWQPHFDRPYTSSMDLLTLPLFGPKDVTTRLAAGVTWLPIANFAQEKFLRPIHPDNVANAAPNADLNNHWHRLLNFLAAPNRTQTAVNLRPASLRTPGLINLNTIRHRGVFAGLVDDFSSQFAAGATDATNPTQLGGHFALATTPITLDSAIDDTDGQKRDWYGEFQRSRDGQDPLTQLYLPGMAHSRPFRPLNFADSGIPGQKDLTKSGVEHTILRSLHKDLLASKANRRGLFEASRSYNDSTLDPLVDFHTRHRLLRKVANNSTTRSNVFVVWISVGMFEAIPQPNGDVQIGGPISGDGAPDHRGFFVIDRSLPETALDQTTLKFDFKKFVPYRKTLQ